MNISGIAIDSVTMLDTDEQLLILRPDYKTRIVPKSYHDEASTIVLWLKAHLSNVTIQHIKSQLNIDE